MANTNRMTHLESIANHAKNVKDFRRENFLAATISFLIVFIGFYVYQNTVMIGWIPPILGGGFTVGVLICLPSLFYEYVRYPGRLKKISLPEIFYFIFLIIFSINISIGILKDKNAQIILSHAASVIHLLGIYFLSRLLPANSNKRVQTIISWSLFILIGITFLNSENIFKSELLVNDFQLNYQAIGFTFLAVSIFAIPNFSSTKRFFAYFCSLSILYIVGARAELIAFFILLVVLEYFKNKKYRIIAFTTFIPLFLLIIFCALFLLYLHDSDNRVFGLFNIQDDQSFIERNILNEEALNTIQSNPICGDYASYEPGRYAHNILSAWVDLGFVGFLLLWCVLISTLSYTIRYNNVNNLFAMSSVSIVVVIFLMITAKPFFYPLLGVAIGLFGRQHAIFYKK
jgi:hypothetical protein